MKFFYWFGRKEEPGTALAAPSVPEEPAPTTEVIKQMKPPSLGLTLVQWDKVNRYDWELTVIDESAKEIFTVRGATSGYGRFLYDTGVEVPWEVQKKLDNIIKLIEWGDHNDKCARVKDA